MSPVHSLDGGLHDHVLDALVPLAQFKGVGGDDEVVRVAGGSGLVRLLVASAQGVRHLPLHPAGNLGSLGVLALVAVAHVDENLSSGGFIRCLDHETRGGNNQLDPFPVHGLHLVLVLQLAEVGVGFSLVLRVRYLLGVLGEHLLELRVLERGLELLDLIRGELQVLEIPRRVVHGRASGDGDRSIKYYFPRSRFGTFSRPIATALRDVRRLTGCPRWITRGPRPVPSRSRARSARCDAATRGCASCSGRRSSAESKIRSRCRSPISRSFGRSRLADWLEVCGKQPDASFGEFPYPSSCHIAGTRLALSHRPPGCFAPQTVSRGCGN